MPRVSPPRPGARNAAGAPNPGTPVALGTTLRGPSWETATTPTSYHLVTRDSGKGPDLAGGGTADGVDVRQWTWLNNACRRWRLVPTT
ncbi:RICIN domain-containing protein [Streptomyces sp. NPDC014995]|uniref:RICIN domain-containing protein n=1 Tax=Streptomyces sp. NPDC014995 TaxID=3364936 RepID=UPI0036F4D307